MRVLILANQKGGAGKSTLAASLAVAAAQDGETVHVLDTDPQASVLNWSQRRRAAEIAVARAEAAELRRELQRVREAGATLAIVDTPGLFGASVSIALQEADLVVIPVKPSILDVEASRPTVEQLRRIGRPYAFVLNMCAPSSQNRTLDAATALVRTGALAPSMLATRSDFLDAMTGGQGVTEVNPKGKAAQEIALLWAWINGKLGELSDAKAAA